MDDSDAAWTRWLQALADPQRGATLVAGGLARTPRWDPGPRTLPAHMLHFVLGGGHAGHVGGVPVATRRNAILWVPAGTPQHAFKDPRERQLAIYFVRFRVRDAAPPPGEPFVRDDVASAYPLFARLHAEASAPMRDGAEAARALLALVFVAWRRAGWRDGAALSPAQRARVLGLVERDPARRISPAALAAAVGLGPAAFARRFAATFGAAPRTWLMRHRIGLAAQRLHERDEPIGVVADAFGYPDVFLFSRQFKRVLGVAPTRWAARRAGG